jgi:hypothetical protein
MTRKPDFNPDTILVCAKTYGFTYNPAHNALISGRFGERVG